MSTNNTNTPVSKEVFVVEAKAPLTTEAMQAQQAEHAKGQMGFRAFIARTIEAVGKKNTNGVEKIEQQSGSGEYYDYSSGEGEESDFEMVGDDENISAVDSASEGSLESTETRDTEISHDNRIKTEPTFEQHICEAVSDEQLEDSSDFGSDDDSNCDYDDGFLSKENAEKMLAIEGALAGTTLEIREKVIPIVYETIEENQFLGEEVDDLHDSVKTYSAEVVALKASALDTTERNNLLKKSATKMGQVINELGSKIDDYEQTISEKESAIKSLEDVVKAKDLAVSEQTRELELTINTLKVDKQGLATKLDGELSKGEALQLRIGELGTKISQLETKLAANSEQARDFGLTITELEHDRQSLTMQLADEAIKSAAHHTRILKLSADKAEVENQLSAQSAIRQELEGRITALQLEKAEARQEFEKSCDSIDLLVSQVASQVQEIEKLKLELAKGLTRSRKMETRICDLSQKLEWEKCNQTELANTMSDLEIERTRTGDLESELDAREYELEVEKAMREGLQTRITQLGREVAAGKSELAVEMSKRKDLEAKKFEHAAEIARGKILESRITQLGFEVACRKKELAAEMSNRKDLEARIAQLEGDVEARQFDLAAETARGKNLESRITQLGFEVVCGKEELAVEISKRKDLEAHIAQLEGEVEARHFDLVAEMAKGKNLEARITQLGFEVARGKEKLEDQARDFGFDIIELENDRQSLNAQLCESDENLHKAQEALRRSQIQHNSVEMQNKVLGDTIENLLVRVGDLTTLKEKASGELAKANTANERLLIAMKEKDGEIEHGNGQQKKLLFDLMAVKEQYNQANSNLGAAEHALGDLRKKLGEAEQKIIELESRNLGLTIDAQAGEKLCDELSGANEAQQTRISELNKALTSRTMSLDKLLVEKKTHDEKLDRLALEKADLEKKLLQQKSYLEKAMFSVLGKEKSDHEKALKQAESDGMDAAVATGLCSSIFWIIVFLLYSFFNSITFISQYTRVILVFFVSVIYLQI
ncbi:hypothetical protein BJ508DRAFT_377846 [Ascobolus immersus RN42]|uniref:Uncharacterized protein n=1 Tax=Ascobolus immersus RN42 TaxID=1160509 RepID=A0A3N4I519_ASCIM|nr:hypothetical protein BJ508DRAFT_377846 [Ascobolus immersus RN42]